MTLATNLVFVDNTTSIDVEAPFNGNFSAITAERFNSAADLLEAVKMQFLCDKAEITPDVTEFKLSASEKRAYAKLFKVRTSFGFGPDSQKKFAADMRTAQNWYAKNCQRVHPISLGNLVSALAAYKVHKALKVPSYLDDAAKRFREVLAETNGASVFKPADPAGKKDGKKTPGNASGVSLKPSELNMVEAAEKELRKALKMGNLTEILEVIDAAQKLLFKVIGTSK